jgi:tyrocidine synthetase-3
MNRQERERVETGLEIAVIGMAGRFPGAHNLQEFWKNLKNGLESISFFSPQELRENGIAEEQLSHPDYVRAYGVLKDKANFDAAFFGYTPKEAEAMDPQVRLFHECTWTALEDAGYNPASYPGLVGVYAGIADGFSWRALKALRTAGSGAGGLESHMLDTSLLLSTRISHKLNLRGPSLTVFSACSTALVAVHLACRALLTGECDMATAGAVSVQPVFKTGYLYQEGMILSPDGHCRPFDERAGGTVFGEGVGVVVLKRLQSARKEGDSIKAVIKGSAVNNDGLAKASFTAPARNRIVDVVKTALKVSGVAAETIGYIETHGTATQLGDTIELDALKLAMAADQKGFCALGSVKSGIGHLDVAAGIAGLIKTVLTLQHRLIPASLHFEVPNPNIDLIDSPFYVNALADEWTNGDCPLRAGVSAFGVGGTNAFMVLEESPVDGQGEGGGRYIAQPCPGCLLVLSARTAPALEQMTVNLVRCLEQNPEVPLPDVAYTLQVGRKAFAHRRLAVCAGVQEAIALLSAPDDARVRSAVVTAGRRPDDGEGERAAHLMAAFRQDKTDGHRLLEDIGDLWLKGVPVDWSALHGDDRRRRLALPTYPFEPRRYWPDGLPRDFSLDSLATLSSPPGKGTGKKEGTGALYARPPLSTAYEAPTNEVQQALVDIWQRFFGIDRVGIRDDFFELGGDSLKVITVVSDIHKQLETQLTIARVFQTPTIKELARFIGEGARDKYAAIPRVEEKEYYPLSSVQKRLYVLHQIDIDSTGYNNPLLFELTGRVDRQQLRDTFRQLIARHESFRTSFETIAGETVQRIHGAVDFDIEYYDRQPEAGDQEYPAAVPDFIRPFVLAQAPLFRVGLISDEARPDSREGRYVLLVDMHHVVTDGTSIGILVREFMSLYAAESLPPLPIQYRDYSEWQRLERQGEAMQAQEDFWLQQFADGVPVLNLPADYVRPTVQSFQGERKSFTVDPAGADRLRDLALGQEATLFMVLLALYNVLLAKICGQEDIVVGTPVAARRHADLRGVIGMLVNTLALRHFPLSHLTVAEFLREVRERTLAAFENQDYLFEELVERVAVRRDVGRNPIFDTMFALQNFDSQYEARPAIEIPGLRLKPLAYENRISIFDLSLFAYEREHGLSFTLEYCSRLFRPETVDRLINCFKRIVGAAAAAPEQRIADIAIIAPEEERQILYEFNHTACALPPEAAVHHLFEAQAAKTPDAAALVFGRSRLTYGELRQQSGRLAGLLRAKGVGPGVVVGLLAARSLEMVTAVVAILKAGGAYLPIDPEYPPARIRYMLADSGVGVAAADSAGAHLLSALELEVVRICEIPDGGEVVNQPVAADSPLYVIYTSGSTGRPKGSMLPHRCGVNLILHQYQHTNIDFGRVLQFAAIGFDVSFQEIFSTLLWGGTLCLVDADSRRDIPQLFRQVEENDIYTLFLPASFLKFVFNQPLYAARFPGSVRHLVAAGEQLIVTDKLRAYVQAHGVYVHNHYGPSETHVVTALTLGPGGEIPPLPTIGTPLMNTHILIVDRGGHLLPIGVAGELWIGGLQVGRGYLNNPDLTAERFVNLAAKGREDTRSPNYYILTPKSQPLYRTGDLARWLPDGRIEFLGRIDHQVKVRGFRIEPGEIESQLLNHPQVKEAAVVVQEDEARGKFLTAYLVLAPTSQTSRTSRTSQTSPAKLRQYLSRTLPAYMIPDYFMILDSIPLTPNRKLDRASLPTPRRESTETYIAPEGGVERRLAQLWAEVLSVGREAIGRDNDFFELGGHSLRATLLMTRIHQCFDVRMTLGEMFSRPTIRGMAAYLQGAARQGFAAIEPVERQAYYPLSSAQKRLYILQQIDLESTVYNMPDAVALDMEMDKQRMTEVFRQLIRRHEALRTYFVTVNQEPVQRVCDTVDFEIDDYDPAGIKNFVCPFILSRPPLLRVGLIHSPGEKDILLTDVHHIVCDGLSVQLLIKEFKTLYDGAVLPRLRIQYRDYACWQHDQFSNEGMVLQERYWLSEFAFDVPVLQLPTDFRRPLLQSFEGDTIRFEIGTDETAALNRLARARGATLFMVLLSAFNILLSKLSGQEDIVVGTPAAGRRHADLTGVIGMFVNTLTLRHFPAAELTFPEFLQQVKEKTLMAYENQDYQFEDLVERVVVNRDAGRNPLFDVMFGLLNEGETGGHDSENRSSLFSTESALSHVSKFDMTWNGLERGGRLFFYIEYCTKLFERETIYRFLDYFRRILQSLVRAPDLKLAEIEVMDEAGRREILVAFNDTGTACPVNETVHRLFEAQAQKTPDCTALVYGRGQLSYGELNRGADRWAAGLRADGIGTGSVVGVMLERSLEMVVGILSVLKSGAACLPIDPEYPRERIRYMLADSGAVTLPTGRPERRPGIPGLSHPHPPPVQATSPLYVIYTSGSTGKAKGIMLPHRSVVNLIRYQYRYTNIDFSRVLQFASIGFDVSFQEIFSTLLWGGTLFLVAEETRRDVPRLCGLIGESHIKTLFLPASFLKFVFNEPVYADLFPPGVRHIVAAGEQLVVGDRFREYLKTHGVYLHNHYGPAETHVVTTLTIDPAGDIPTLPAIGRPLVNTRIYIVGGGWQLRPLKVAGELLIGGLQVARGYLNNPELTADRFINVAAKLREDTRSPKHEILTPKSQPLYRTGDLCRWLPDGNLEFLGRIDHQVKIRGFRIEPGEIENQLLDIDYIRESVVIDRENSNGEKYLCAYVVADRRVLPSELRERLSRVLPDYMVPAYFVQVEQIPLTPNRKVDRRSLPLPQLETGKEYAAPLDNVERTLVELWCDILGIGPDTIGVDVSFFELGGHSLKATILMTRLHQRFRVKVSLGEIFKNPTVRGLAAYIRQAAAQHYGPIERCEEREYYPLSSAQKRLYILQQMALDSTVYHLPQGLPLAAEVDSARLARAFEKLIARHESLRTSFFTVGDEPVQRVHRQVDFNIEYPTAGTESDFVSAFFRSFDLSQAPLLRVGSVSLKGGRHLLLVDMHHIISDGTSMAILLEEFQLLYRRKGLPGLPELPIQYRDYARWQNSEKRRPQIKLKEAFWLEVFPGEVPVLQLAADYPRPAVQRFEGSTVGFEMGDRETDGLNRLALDQGATLFMVLLALFNVLLSRLGGQEDIVVGSPTAGRHHAMLEGIVGMFVNTLALRNFPAAERTFAEFLAEVKERTLAAFENQEYPFEDLVEKVAVRRDAGRNPLFDVILMLQNIGKVGWGSRDKKPASQAGLPASEGRVARLDMTWSGQERGGRLCFEIEYSTRLFKKETVYRFIGTFKQVVAAVLKAPAAKIADIDVIDEAERRKIVQEFNDTAAKFPPAAAIHRLFEDQVERTPQRMALVGPMLTGAADRLPFQGQLTYRQLNGRANRLALRLGADGMCPQAIGAVIMERSLEMVIAVFAILKSGAAYLPIDPDYPRQRIDYLLADSGAGVVLTGHEEGLFAAAHVGEEEPGPGDESSLSSLAYVIYTSGSTGRPRGVMIQHGSLVNTLFSLFHKYPFGQQDTYLFKTPSVFDVSVSELFSWFLGGGRLALLQRGAEKDPRRILAALGRYRVTHLNFVPAMFAVFAAALTPGDSRQLSALKYIFLAGEELLPPPVQAFSPSAPHVILENLYGPTETAIYASGYPLQNWHGTAKIPIGRPLANTRLYILDKSLHLQPIGIPGELAIAGSGLARGYLNNPDLTAEKFININLAAKAREDTRSQKHKILTPKSQPLYRTGDLCRWLPDGNLEFLGRIDHQVKVRGFRIELGEIENRLLNHPAVREAVVIGREDNSGERYLCAYVVADRQVLPSELRELLLKVLPDYMVPAYFVRLEKLPHTPSGKVDRRGLPLPRLAAGQDYAAPRDKVERSLVALWSDILGIGRDVIGVDVSFFDLGGHSLKATVLLARIHRELGVRLPLGEVFKAPTIRGLAACIRQAAAEGHEGIGLAEQRAYYPLSSAQKRLYILQQMEAVGTVYNMPQLVRLDRELDRHRLAYAFRQLLRRHESLRTSFTVVHGEPVQRVHESVDFDIEHYGPGEKTGFVRPFDLAKAPLLRVGLAPLEAGHRLLLVDMHHIVGDGVSMTILVEEFRACYEGKELPGLRIQYKDFAVWQNSKNIREKIKSQEAYWLREFAGEVPVLNLFTDYPRPAVQSFEGAALGFEIGPEETAGLKALAAAGGMTLFMVLMAVYTILLARLSGQEDMVVGTPAAGRRHADLQGVVGMFVNTLALRIAPIGDKTCATFLAEVKARTLQAYENQEYPFEDLVERVMVRRDAGRNPLFDVMLGLQNFSEDRGGLGYRQRVARFDLSWLFSERGNRLQCDIEYCTRLFKGETVERFGHYFKRIAGAVAASPQVRIAGIDMMGPAERRRVLVDFNGTATECPGDQTIPEWFAGIAERVPDRIAVVVDFEQRAVTFGELDRRANRLAHRLRGQGIRTDTIAAFMSACSIELAVALLGILKSGGAYLPLDPTYPSERIRFMLEESGARVPDLSLSGEDGPSRPLPPVPAFSLAYVIYTSGSTGRPKGAAVCHAGLVNYTRWRLSAYPYRDDEVTLQLLSHGFDGFGANFYPGLLCGGRLMLVPEAKKLAVTFIASTLGRQRVTNLSLVPGLYEPLVRAASAADLATMRFVVLAGEQADPGLIAESKRKNPHLRHMIEYGPTEATVTAAAHLDADESGTAVIGRPIANTRLYIVDRYLYPSPPGVPGELCIAGVGLARGYLNNPELTADKFMNLAAKGREGTRSPNHQILTPKSQPLYRTGDLARFLPDGQIEFLGRIDHQVKIRGFRIEPAEIEHQLLQHPDVKEALVTVCRNETRDKYLIAYIVPPPPNRTSRTSQTSRTSPSTLRQYLSRTLPDYMIPTYFVQLAKMPRTPHGKIDRAALPAVDHGEVDNYVPPRNEVEAVLQQVWAEVLGLERNRIGIHANFFELGGHSLKAVRAVSLLARDFDITVDRFFRHQTIAQLAAHIHFDPGRLKRLVKEGIERAKAGPPPAPGARPGELKEAYAAYRQRIARERQLDLSAVKGYRHILLTGVTGYLGAHLLFELLTTKEAVIYLPVRAGSEEEAARRVRDTLAFYFGPGFYEAHQRRLAVLAGDLSLPGLGLGTGDYRQLTSRIEAVIHAAARVKHFGVYEDFKLHNVTATENLLDFCLDTCLKDFNYISTMSVCAGALEGREGLLVTEYRQDAGQRLMGGYLQTKFEAEKRVAAYRQRGLKTSIFRVGNIVCHSETGKFQINIADNAFYNRLASVIKSGMIPTDSSQMLDFTFVDCLARAIGLLFDRQALENEIYHLLNDNHLSTAELAALLRRGGEAVEAVSLETFLEYFYARLRQPGVGPETERFLLHSGLLSVGEGEGNGQAGPEHTGVTVSAERTHMLLHKLGFQWPQVNERHIRKMLAYCRQVKFLDPGQGEIIDV